MATFDFLDFRSDLPGRRRRHPEPPDDHRTTDSNANPRPKTTDEPDRCSQPVGDANDHDVTSLWPMKITQSAYRGILDYFLSREPEAAGILLGPVQDDQVITHFLPDEDGDATSVSFHLNAPGVNRTLKRVKPAGLNGKGLIHSHLPGITQPSGGDIAYMRQLFGMPANATAQQCFLPIVCDRRVYPYVYARGRLWLAELILI